MAYDADSANGLPPLRNKENDAVHMQKISARISAVISTLSALFSSLLLP
jgi:hypothetical protein